MEVLKRQIQLNEKGCWIWLGSQRPAHHKRINGKMRTILAYGQQTFRRKRWSAHRLSWTVFKGDIPAGKCVCHRCDTPLCINPDHLFLGSALDNSTDAKEKNRHPFGEKHPKHKLTDKVVKQMRTVYQPCSRNFGQRALAKKFKCAVGLVCDVLNGKRWSHVKPSKAIALNTTELCHAEESQKDSPSGQA